MDDSTAIEKFRFTIDQLRLLTAKFRLGESVVTPANDRVSSLEALAIVCRRLSEPSKLHTVACDNILRLRRPAGIPLYSNQFNSAMDDPTSIELYRFSMVQLALLSVKLGLPSNVITPAGDNISRLEALALLCRWFTEPSKLFTVANEFGRSTAAVSRIVLHVTRQLYAGHVDLLYINADMIRARIYIARPSPRPGNRTHENLQRSVYYGHPRRHCLNWQGVTTTDGIIVSAYGPVEGRRHDSTVLSYSKVLDFFCTDTSGIYNGRVLYGDPAYRCNQFLLCPCPLASPGSRPQRFNSRMSKVREAVEWSFGRLKILWPFVFDAKTMQVCRTP
ncbi:hypothetical protein ACHHYP_14599 [Achlya hypogyna]|uniref:DDE Tnp4 domain-containing protein n=1 Tax=Achlya hypogyna TaxID=1202772 RepID=A0A1V9YCW8_ACHHY|nr:hypothetical protein ACHHYP_14599 [Achlya hypogyna]